MIDLHVGPLSWREQELVASLRLQALKLTRWAERPFVRALGWVILAGNILEAVVAEAAHGGLVNASAGVLLILALPGPDGIHVAAPEAGRDMRYPLPWSWLAAYTLWNFTFVYDRHSHGSIGVGAALAVIHLGAPLIATRGDGAVYFQARAYVLGAMGFVHMGLPYPPFDHAAAGWYAPSVAQTLGLASLAVAAFACGARLRSRRAMLAARHAADLAPPPHGAPGPHPGRLQSTGAGV